MGTPQQAHPPRTPPTHTSRLSALHNEQKQEQKNKHRPITHPPNMAQRRRYPLLVTRHTCSTTQQTQATQRSHKHGAKPDDFERCRRRRVSGPYRRQSSLHMARTTVHTRTKQRCHTGRLKCVAGWGAGCGVPGCRCKHKWQPGLSSGCAECDWCG